MNNTMLKDEFSVDYGTQNRRNNMSFNRQISIGAFNNETIKTTKRDKDKDSNFGDNVNYYNDFTFKFTYTCS